MSIVGGFPIRGRHSFFREYEQTAHKFANDFVRKADTFISAAISAQRLGGSIETHPQMQPYLDILENYEGKSLRVSFKLDLRMEFIRYGIHIVWFCDDAGEETSGDEPAGAFLDDWYTPEEMRGKGRATTADAVYEIALDLLKEPK